MSISYKIGRKAGRRAKEFLNEHGNNPYGWAVGVTWIYVYAQLVYEDWMESWKESSDVTGFLLSELMGFIFNFGFEAAINVFIAGFYAAIWPFFWFMEVSKWLS
jgi:hypothetical protein